MNSKKHESVALTRPASKNEAIKQLNEEAIILQNLKGFLDRVTITGLKEVSAFNSCMNYIVNREAELS